MLTGLFSSGLSSVIFLAIGFVLGIALVCIRGRYMKALEQIRLFKDQVDLADIHCRTQHHSVSVLVTALLSHCECMRTFPAGEGVCKFEITIPGDPKRRMVITRTLRKSSDQGNTYSYVVEHDFRGRMSVADCFPEEVAAEVCRFIETQG